MRSAPALILAAILCVAATSVAPARISELASAEQVLGWIKGYRSNPDPGQMPGAAKLLSRLGAFQEPDAAGVYIGFIAGVIGSNPSQAEKTVRGLLAMPVEDHWVIVRAVAYSGLPEWQALMAEFADRIPTRGPMVNAYLAGKLPTLEQLQVGERPSAFARLKSSLSFRKQPPKEAELEPSPVILDTLWGYYFATGEQWPLAQIVNMLPWSADGEDVGRLIIGSSAKYSLATNASRDLVLLAALKDSRPSADKKVAPILDEVIFAAETVETGKIREEARAALEELRSKGPGSRRKIAWWGRVGEGAIALGCVVAAVTGHVELGVPCVVGGAVSSAALRFFAGQG